MTVVIPWKIIVLLLIILVLVVGCVAAFFIYKHMKRNSD